MPYCGKMAEAMVLVSEAWERKRKEFQDNWWYSRRRGGLEVLMRSAKTPGDAKILEVGCGTGHNYQFLKRYGDYHGMDSSNVMIELVTSYGLQKVALGDAVNMPYKDDAFDVVLALDVIEHIENDALAIQEMNRVLREGGIIVISVPAFKWMWSMLDSLAGHKRRYTKKVVTDLVTSRGFRVERVTYWNFLLFFPISLYRIFENALRYDKRHQEPFYTKPLVSRGDKLFRFLLSMENKAIQKGLNFPFGVSIFCVARKG